MESEYVKLFYRTGRLCKVTNTMHALPYVNMKFKTEELADYFAGCLHQQKIILNYENEFSEMMITSKRQIDILFIFGRTLN